MSVPLNVTRGFLIFAEGIGRGHNLSQNIEDFFIVCHSLKWSWIIITRTKSAIKLSIKVVLYLISFSYFVTGWNRTKWNTETLHLTLHALFY